MPIFGFFGGNLSGLAKSGSRLEAWGSGLEARGSKARGLGLQAHKIASPHCSLINHVPFTQPTTQPCEF